MNFRHLDNQVDSGNTKTADDGKCKDQVSIIYHVPLMSCFTHTMCNFAQNMRFSGTIKSCTFQTK